MNWEHNLSIGVILLFLTKEGWTWYKDSMLKIELVNQALRALPKIQDDLEELKKDVNNAHNGIRELKSLYALKAKDHPG